MDLYISTHLADEITLADLADAASMSPYHFIRAFKATTGLTPFRYLQAKRVEAARKMLADTAAPVSVVAIECGFASHSHFSTAFKAATGMTPSQYRAQTDL